MIKFLIVASVVFGAMFSFGLLLDNIPEAEMKKTLEVLSGGMINNLEIDGFLLGETQNDLPPPEVIESAIAFETEVVTVDPNGVPNTRDEYFINAISHCIYHSDEDLDSETCVVCELTDSEENPLGTGRTDLPDGYFASQSIPIEITPEYLGSNDVTNVEGVIIEVCESGFGCSQGFWKNHLEMAEKLGILSDSNFREMFGLLDTEELEITVEGESISDPTLEEALNAQGGGINALVRHAAAAYLNAQSAIDYPLSPEQVISNFYESYSSENYVDTKDLFEELNALGCPFDDDIGDLSQ